MLSRGYDDEEVGMEGILRQKEKAIRKPAQTVCGPVLPRGRE